MTAPFTIVTLLDDDDEEFPIRLLGHRSEAEDEEAALAGSTGLIAEDGWTPNGKLRFGYRERFPKR